MTHCDPMTQVFTYNNLQTIINTVYCDPYCDPMTRLFVYIDLHARET